MTTTLCGVWCTRQNDMSCKTIERLMGTTNIPIICNITTNNLRCYCQHTNAPMANYQLVLENSFLVKPVVLEKGDLFILGPRTNTLHRRAIAKGNYKRVILLHRSLHLCSTTHFDLLPRFLFLLTLQQICTLDCIPMAESVHCFLRYLGKFETEMSMA